MTIDEAYEITMTAIEELKELGVRVEVRPSGTRNNPEFVERYNKPGCISPDKWYHVSFSSDTPKLAKAVYDSAENLRKLGIGFDTGGFAEYRDWEIDWSFTYSDEPDEDLATRRAVVEEILTGLAPGEELDLSKLDVSEEVGCDGVDIKKLRRQAVGAIHEILNFTSYVAHSNDLIEKALKDHGMWDKLSSKECRNPPYRDVPQLLSDRSGACNAIADTLEEFVKMLRAYYKELDEEIAKEGQKPRRYSVSLYSGRTGSEGPITILADSHEDAIAKVMMEIDEDRDMAFDCYDLDASSENLDDLNDKWKGKVLCNMLAAYQPVKDS